MILKETFNKTMQNSTPDFSTELTTETSLQRENKRIRGNRKFNQRSSSRKRQQNRAYRFFSATAYCLKGRTASGSGVRRGIVAADPRILPLGTRINLGAGSYSGSYIVADTGGAIKGRKFDIWVANCSEAKRFGRRTVTVNRSAK
jgi:3D (Asp-Asp-Asp) domain-containing protein